MVGMSTARISQDSSIAATCSGRSDRFARADPYRLGEHLAAAALEQDDAADLLAPRANPVEIVEPEPG